MAIVFITGATGFIGKEVTKQLARAGHTVLALVRSLEKWDELLMQMTPTERSYCNAVRGDLRKAGLGLSASDYEQVLRATVIIHAGVPMDISMDETVGRDVILQGASHLAAVANELHKQQRLQKLIHIVGYMSPFDDESGKLATDVFATNDFLREAGGYEKYKFLADLYLRQEAYQKGMPLVVVNPCTIIGPRSTGNTEQTDGLGLVISSMRRGKIPVLPGGKEWWLPLLAVDDLAEVIVGIVETNHIEHQTYYALNERSATPAFSELISLMAKELRMKPPAIPFPVSVLKKILHNGGGRLLGVPANSMDFIVKKDFPLTPFQQMKAKKGIDAYDVAAYLPSVIADLDYRLSVKDQKVPPHFHREQIAGMAAYKKEGSGTPWLLVHGLFSEMSDLLPLAEQLGEQAVWLLDLPGFGRSPYHHHEKTIEGFIEAVAEALRQLPSPVHLAGHSFGGFLAWEAAKRVPEKIEKLYLLQPPLHAPKYSLLLAGLGKSPALLQRFLQKQLTPANMENAMLEQGVFQSTDEMPEGYVEKAGKLLQSPRISKTHTDVLRYFMNEYRQMSLTTTQPFPFPAQIVWGTQDKTYQLTKGTADAFIKANVEIERLSAAHHFPLSHPQLTANVLLQMRHGKK
ncbi:nucleoside-diphosphate-sugar epimerase [Brevibacillus sp. AG162]|uniref:alpha/beta fold hydrolase n=1 Tax=Brevibacillus sp. AG162 TaxID=2572910 RepID=UPI00114F2183|nr:alpha/beta fold hydrolase [Brevibacillus sp. AG162]TQK53902.1 nucleoside-diphosphate-sugar epimerase [Brevibacillus sp. AG162]